MTDVLDLPAREPDEVLRYGPAPEQIADVYRGGGAPVVLVHGGFWRNRYDRRHARPLAAALADRGFDVLLPEYRRIGDPGGGRPGTFDDVRSVVAAIPRLGAARATLVGHSAGGHLAMWSQAVDPSPHVSSVVALAGVLDLQAAADARLSADAVTALLGPSDEHRARADPLRLPAPPMPVSVVHGDRDAEVPVAYSRRYARRHASATLHELPGVGHFELIDPREPAFEVLLGLLAD
ncbi:alpha/beta hydrolase fold domain-containing protein [Rathayibacter sp. VKM Ac-2803]|uniref:alpha/beta fold hydrolase n=1 Tax=Rathayibacter sp. VKM Ac-2803 TaxID=2609256 RepID=UPI00135AEB8C|nr:alpha/beta hydrolase [Rathayibacter sp. VKM Ac-2803]MWV47767.1 alpha/beta hydrolase fold domain-containing protein [Rathayibacter sp. VKM Ac-2803]